jgi:hypothetical protein
MMANRARALARKKRVMVKRILEARLPTDLQKEATKLVIQ